MPIEEVDALNRDFDLIVSTGVLHHLQDPVVGLTALGERLRPDGVASIMLYARYGRIGVEMLQGVFRELGLGQDEWSVDMVRHAVATLPADHPVQSYLDIAPDLQFDAGLVDTFLHGRERSYTTGECIELATAAGLVFDDWLLKAPYAVPEDPDNAFLTAIAQLPREQQWSIMERIHFRNGCHFFNVCRPERPTATYRIDFSTDAFLDYVPSLRYRCTFDGVTIGRADWTTPLVPAQGAHEHHYEHQPEQVTEDPENAGADRLIDPHARPGRSTESDVVIGGDERPEPEHHTEDTVGQAFGHADGDR